MSLTSGVHAMVHTDLPSFRMDQSVVMNASTILGRARAKPMNRFPRYCFIWCAACIVGSDLRANAQDDKIDHAAALAKFKDFDSIFESGMTVSGTAQHKDVISRRPPTRLNVNRRWRMTVDGERVAYHLEVIEYEKPKYLEELVEGPEKVMRIDVRIKRWGYWGAELKGHYYEDRCVAVTPTGEVTERSTVYNTSLFGVRDEGPIPTKRIALWSLGRFFSKQLDKVTRVEKTAEGRLVLSATGKKDDHDYGRWELEIEPAAAWMVRKARYYREQYSDKVSAEMTNEGTVWSGPHCVPKEAMCNYFGPIDGPETEKLTFEPVVLPFDEKMYIEARKAVLDNKEETLYVHDYRVTPPRTLQPNRPKRVVEPPAPASPGRMWLLVANLIVCMAIFLYFVLRKRQSKDTPGEATK